MSAIRFRILYVQYFKILNWQLSMQGAINSNLQLRLKPVFTHYWLTKICKRHAAKRNIWNQKKVVQQSCYGMFKRAYMYGLNLITSGLQTVYRKKLGQFLLYSYIFSALQRGNNSSWMLYLTTDLFLETAPICT